MADGGTPFFQLPSILHHPFSIIPSPSSTIYHPSSAIYSAIWKKNCRMITTITRQNKCCKPVSRILFSSMKAERLSFICPEACATGSICLPCILPAEAGIERAALEGYYTWHFSMQGLPAVDVATNSRELLPHVFSLTGSFSQRIADL